MCIEDIRLGRKLAAAAKTVNAVLATQTPLIAADPKRTRIVIATTGGLVCVAPLGINPVLAGGFNVSGTLSPLVLTVEQIGPLVEGPWTCAAVVADTLCLVITSQLGVE